MKCPKCQTFLLFGNVKLDGRDIWYTCHNCSFGSNNVRDFMAKAKEEEKCT